MQRDVEGEIPAPEAGGVTARLVVLLEYQDFFTLL